MKTTLLFTLIFSSSLTLANTKITVSGISSGAYLAQQYHTAHSAEVSGVGIVAGGPYFCSHGQIADALNKCMKTYMGTPVAADSVAESKKMARTHLIDDVRNISTAKVYAISGTKDDTVLQKVSDVMVETYKIWGVSGSNLRYDNKTPVGHAFPTDNFGNSCGTASSSPYISNCGKDVAGEILNHLIGPLAPKTTPKSNRFFTFEQLNDTDGIDLDKLSMGKTGYAYIPDGCEFPEAGGCSIHVALHGCHQNLDEIQTTFITKAGYNSWAESNKIVVVYPQAIKNASVSNPNGCWDWWGYTGPKFHTKEGPQIKVISKIVEALRAGTLQLKQVQL